MFAHSFSLPDLECLCSLARHVCAWPWFAGCQTDHAWSRAMSHRLREGVANRQPWGGQDSRIQALSQPIRELKGAFLQQQIEGDARRSIAVGRASGADKSLPYKDSLRLHSTDSSDCTELYLINSLCQKKTSELEEITASSFDPAPA